MDIFTGLLFLTLNIYHEARGEDEMAKLAVAHVTWNRVHDRKQNLKEVVMSPYQFSWTHQLDNYIPDDVKAFNDCMRIAKLSLFSIDFTGGATYYHHERVNPYWAKEFIYLGQWGKHKFYKEK